MSKKKQDEQVPDKIVLNCSAPIELAIEAAEDGKSKVPTFSMVGYTGGPMNVGFGRPVMVDLSGVKVNGSIPIFRGHDPDKIVGHGKAIIADGQILADGIISAENEHSRDVIASSKNGFPWQASIGASVDEMESLGEKDTATVNGQTVKGPLLIARKSTLNEISFVPLGADRKTSAKVAASAHNKEIEMNEFQKWLEANDFPAETELSDKAKAKLQAQFTEETKSLPSPHGKDFVESMKATRQEKDRIDGINAVAEQFLASYPTQLEQIEQMVINAHANQTVGVEKFKQLEIELLHASRPVGPSNIASNRTESETNARVVEAALAKTIGLNNLEKHYDERTLDATDRHFRNGVGLKDMLRIAASANGHNMHTTSDVRTLLKCAFKEDGGGVNIRAGGFSTFSLSGILGNIMQKRLEDYFNAVDSAWREISKISRVTDFKQTTAYSLTGDMQYEELGAAGEIKHGTLGEESYTNQARTYAKMLAITRQDIINDDLGAFDRVPQRLGRGGALKINDVFWTVFLDNASFFSSGNNNVSTGGGSALGTSDGAAINAAEVIFMNQTDPDGKPLGVTPRILLAPPTLRNTAARWMGGQLVVSGADSTLPNVNVYEGRYRVVSSPYMENTSYTGDSTTAWYLLADPMDLPVIETVFLNGRQMPTVESADADFDTLGVQIRAYHDFGVALQEPRGGVRSAGT